MANLDAPGKTIEIPEGVFDKSIPELVDAQLNTPLPRLQGKTLFDILPDLRKNMRKYLEISDQWVDAIKAGKKPEDVQFDAANTKQGNVFRAGQIAFLKLVAGGMDEVEANRSVNAFSDNFSDRVHAALQANAPTEMPTPTRLRLTAQQRTALGMGPFAELRAGVAAGDNVAGGDTSGSAADVSDALSTAKLSRLQRLNNWYGRNAFLITTGGAAYGVQDLTGMHQLQKEILESWEKNPPGS